MEDSAAGTTSASSKSTGAATGPRPHGSPPVMQAASPAMRSDCPGCLTIVQVASRGGATPTHPSPHLSRCHGQLMEDHLHRAADVQSLAPGHPVGSASHTWGPETIQGISPSRQAPDVHGCSSGHSGTRNPDCQMYKSLRQRTSSTSKQAASPAMRRCGPGFLAASQPPTQQGAAITSPHLRMEYQDSREANGMLQAIGVPPLSPGSLRLCTRFNLHPWCRKRDRCLAHLGRPLMAVGASPTVPLPSAGVGRTPGL